MKKIFSLLLMGLLIMGIVGCSKTANVNLSDIFKEIKTQLSEDMKTAGASEDAFKDGVLPGFVEVDLMKDEANPFAKELQEVFNKEDLEAGYFLGQMMSVKSDQIIILKAKDESKVENLKKVLEEQKQAQINTWEHYLPDQYEKVKNNIIKSQGKYLIYITYDNPEAVETIFDNFMK